MGDPLQYVETTDEAAFSVEPTNGLPPMLSLLMGGQHTLSSLLMCGYLLCRAN